MVDEKLIIEKLESLKDKVGQKLKKPYMTKYISPDQFCYLMDNIIKYTITNKEKECKHNWIPCGLTTIRNPTVTKSSLSNGQYKLFECVKCGERKFELIEGACSHNWIYLGCNVSGEHYVCSKCKEFKVYPITE